MSYAAHALPPDERPPDLQPQPEPRAQAELNLKPGQQIEYDRLDALLDQIISRRADLKLHKAQGDYALFESAAHDLAALANHFAKSVTNQRPRPPQRANKE